MKIVFLYDIANQIIYIMISKKTKIEETKNMICKLLKAFYSLK